jgi:hypothetical protein
MAPTAFPPPISATALHTSDVVQARATGAIYIPLSTCVNPWATPTTVPRIRRRQRQRSRWRRYRWSSPTSAGDRGSRKGSCAQEHEKSSHVFKRMSRSTMHPQSAQQISTTEVYEHAP